MDRPSPVVLHEQDVDAESWDDATRGTLTFRTLFGGPAVRTGQFTAGVADLEPGEWLGVHSHEQAEVYYVFQGELLLQLDVLGRQVGDRRLIGGWPPSALWRR